MLLGAGKKLSLAEGDMVFTARIGRTSNVAVRYQQLRMLTLAQRRQQAVFTGAGGTDQPNQFSCHQKTLLPCRQT